MKANLNIHATLLVVYEQIIIKLNMFLIIAVHVNIIFSLSLIHMSINIVQRSYLSFYLPWHRNKQARTNSVDLEKTPQIVGTR